MTADLHTSFIPTENKGYEKQKGDAERQKKA